MANSNRKGAKAERAIVNWLAEHEWAVLRAPSSGSATKRDLPDLLAGNGNRFVAAEVKRVGDDVVYIDRSEINALEFFAEKFGAEPMVAVKFDLEYTDPAYGADRPGFYFLHINQLHETPSGNYRIRKPSAQNVGTAEEDL